MLDSETALESLYAGVNLISLVIVEQVIYGEKEEGEENSFLKNMADLICQLGWKLASEENKRQLHGPMVPIRQGEDWGASLEIAHISINHVDNWLELQEEEVSHKASLNRRWYRTSLSTHCPEIEWQPNALRMALMAGWNTACLLT